MSLSKRSLGKRETLRRTYGVERGCEACGSHSPYRGFEWAHIIPDAGSKKGCKCSENMMDLCWRCHRLIAHGLGGWARLCETYRHVKVRYDVAVEHYQARCRGEGCGANTKCGQIARMRQEQAT